MNQEIEYVQFGKRRVPILGTVGDGGVIDWHMTPDEYVDPDQPIPYEVTDLAHRMRQIGDAQGSNG